ncbi:MAG: nucleotidyltransferase domain-containing protein [candidate division KSB1 bacterium]|nr:nucleotidyltransferase domain-containing protein [candidate division KSB1 bacterium]MDZ7334827.1 nucleotidyltransferase domain-containing protein [candidate division KSB1 bacterium]MDZ7356543.1 nucleotidyltransferase domain-containing protein [candidate division KSB1 bacterium]MDZ7376458.1 nucleotidyltransferase domain-containing protein [candidate division KSB1 bacterium]MDZ7400444.1 nucleotidyltransferase domain-containing protein [candidate division KSB1 bacterium]
MRFGLREHEIKQLTQIIFSFPEVQEAIIFGSRAMGNFKSGSDVDIAIRGKNITHEIITQIRYLLNEETLMPYFFDVVDYDQITNEDLKQHIDQFGKELLPSKPAIDVSI